MDYLINEIPYFQTPNEIFECDLSVNEKIVFVYLCRCCNNGKVAFPSQQTIADKCSISKSSAKRAISVLTNEGYIVKERRIKAGKNYSNVYKVNFNRVTQNLHRVSENLDGVTVNHYKELPINNYVEKTNYLHSFGERTCALLEYLNDYSLSLFNKPIRKHVYKEYDLDYLFEAIEEKGYEEVLSMLVDKYDHCNLDYLATVQERIV